MLVSIYEINGFKEGKVEAISSKVFGYFRIINGKIYHAENIKDGFVESNKPEEFFLDKTFKPYYARESVIIVNGSSYKL